MKFKEEPYQESVNNIQQEAKPTELQIFKLEHRDTMSKLMDIESSKSPGELYEDFEYINLIKKEGELREKIDELEK